MPAWVVWIIIAVAALLIVFAVAWATASKRRTQRLRAGFGPEYDRTLTEHRGRREAESELRAREDRRAKLDIRPLTTASRQRFAEAWHVTQARSDGGGHTTGRLRLNLGPLDGKPPVSKGDRTC